MSTRAATLRSFCLGVGLYLASNLLAPALVAQVPFLDGVEGELYYAVRIDRIPAADGGPLSIDLDGQLDETAWKRANFHTYTEYWKGGKLPEDDADCLPLFAVLADENFLYVAWRIADSSINAGQSPGCGAFNDDDIELHLDGNGEGVTCGSCAYQLDDVQCLIGADQMGKGDPSLLEVGWVRSGGCVFSGIPVEASTGENIISGVVDELADGGGLTGWQGEIAIALKASTYGEWDIDSTHGNVIGWDVHFDDDDDGDGQDGDDSALIWSKRDPNSQAWQNPGVWGKLQFITPGKPLVTISRDLPDDLRNGSSGVVSLTVNPDVGTGNVIIKEKLPPALVPSNPSGGGTIADNTVTWDLGQVTSQVIVTYTLTAGLDAADGKLPGTATIDQEPLYIGGDKFYRGGPISAQGFIKLWNHLGPFAFVAPPVAADHGPPGACDANGGIDLALDWVINEGETLTELDMNPFPGMIVKPKYGGNGVLGGTGARAAGLVVGVGDTGEVSTDQYPVWKAAVSSSDTIDHNSSSVFGFDPDDHMTMSCVYVTNHTGSAIDTTIGFASDDSIQVLLDDVDLTGGGIPICRGYDAANVEQNTALVTLPAGESKLIVKVTDGGGLSGFRIRFQDPTDPLAPGLQAPDITVSLESSRNPPAARVTRSFSSETFAIGGSVDVSLAISAPQATNLSVHELLPDFVSVSGISDGGVATSGVITWNLTGVTNKTLTYTLSPAECITKIGFTGSTWEAGPIEAFVVGQSALTGAQPVDTPLDSWVATDIGPQVGASQALGEHDVIVQAGGSGIALATDGFRFVHVPASGDFELTAKVDCIEDPSSRGQGGLMVRDTLDPASANIFFGVVANPISATSVGTLKATSRRETNNNRSTSPITLTSREVTNYPIYLRMKRTGAKVSFLRSYDGADFAEVGTRDIGESSTTVNLKNDTILGLAVAGSGEVTTRVVFRDVSGPPFKTVNVGTQFHRGDADDNNKLELTDAVRILGYLFLGSPAPGCLEAADSDNNGKLELTDAVRILGYLFLGNPPPASPGPPPENCGTDPPDTGDLGCEAYASC